VDQEVVRSVGGSSGEEVGVSGISSNVPSELSGLCGGGMSTISWWWFCVSGYWIDMRGSFKRQNLATEYESLRSMILVLKFGDFAVEEIEKVRSEEIED